MRFVVDVEVANKYKCVASLVLVLTLVHFTQYRPSKLQPDAATGYKIIQIYFLLLIFIAHYVLVFYC